MLLPCFAFALLCFSFASGQTEEVPVVGSTSRSLQACPSDFDEVGVIIARYPKQVLRQIIESRLWRQRRTSGLGSDGLRLAE